MEKVYGVNPQTGEKIYKTKRVLTYGISDAEYSVIESNLPSKDIDLCDCTDCFTDIIALSFIAVIINPDAASAEDLDMLNSLYSDLCGAYTEKIIFTKQSDKLALFNKNVKLTILRDFDDFERSIKYLLLESLQSERKMENYSEVIAQTIRVLSEIKRKSGITTAELAKITEKNPRTVLRYINTLGCAGELIQYDNKNHGWFIMGGKSLLLGEI